VHGKRYHARLIRLVLAALLLPFLLFGTPVRAESIELTPCVAPIRSGDTPTSVLFDRQRFSCGEAQAHFTPGDYWVRMDVPDAPLTARNVLIFSAGSLWDDGVSITVFDANGAIRKFSADPKASPSPMRLGTDFAIPLHMHGAPVRAIVARVENSQIVRGVMHRPKLSSPHSAREQELALAALYAAFAGICLGLLFYNAALWWAMREPFLLAYCSMVTALLVYSLFTSGAPHYVFDGWTGGDRLRFTIPLLAITASVGMWFVSCFFTTTPLPRWLRLATYVQIAWLPTVGFGYALLGTSNIKLFDTAYMLSFLPLPLLFFCYLHAAWRHRDPLLPYFVIAWSMPFLSVVMRILRGFDVVPPTAVIENSTLIGLAFEALVSSLAIGYRVRLLAQDRDRAELGQAHAVAIAETDPLTGLLNRRAFLSRLLERKSNWTLLLLDIDHFKRVNDSLGHAGGDEALIAIGRMLQREAPGGALVARMGGEEFAIAYRGAMLLLDPAELLAKIRKVELPDGYRITASIGIANRTVESEHDWKILYRAADMALYRAKSGGRDCFIHVQTPTMAVA
jgi:diguanylate cyclase (GGDEF)-like protein